MEETTLKKCKSSEIRKKTYINLIDNGLRLKNACAYFSEFMGEFSSQHGHKNICPKWPNAGYKMSGSNVGNTRRSLKEF